MKKQTIAIYIHIPFCNSRCAYCSFVSTCKKEKDQTAYFKRLEKEILSEAINNKTKLVKSIYFGGGTPSVVNKKFIKNILDVIKDNYNESKNAEITLEGNPNSLTKNKLEFYKEIGINRLSIGVQSLNDNELVSIGRCHTREQAVRCVKTAQQVGFDNISVDVMMGIPNQTLKSYKKTLLNVCKLNVQHISAYMLILEQNTLLDKQVKEKVVQLPDDEQTAEMFEMTNLLLKQKEFARYEISAYAKKGYESKHNKTYWEMGEYLGFGLSAHGFTSNLRTENTSNFSRYLNGEPKKKTPQTREETIDDSIMVGLRSKKGVSIKYLMSLGYDILSSKNKELKMLKDANLISISKYYIKIKERGFLIANQIILKLI